MGFDPEWIHVRFVEGRFHAPKYNLGRCPLSCWVVCRKSAGVDGSWGWRKICSSGSHCLNRYKVEKEVWKKEGDTPKVERHGERRGPVVFARAKPVAIDVESLGNQSANLESKGSYKKVTRIN